MVTKQHKHPIFNMYSLDRLVELTGWSAWTVLDMRDRGRPPSKRFMRMCSLATGRTEEELFGPADVETEMETPVADEQEA